MFTNLIEYKKMMDEVTVVSFRFISNHPDYDFQKNVLEFVECEKGEMTYDEMEKLVIGLLDLGLIPKDSLIVGGFVTIIGMNTNIEINHFVRCMVM